MMLKMMNPFGSVTDSIPGVGGGDKDDDDGLTKEEQVEQEKLRQDAIKQAEKERRDKYKKMEDDREGIRQGIRDKYNIEKKPGEEEEEDDDDDDDFGGSKKEPVADDPVSQAKAMAEAQMANATKMAADQAEKCSIQ